MSLQKPDFRAGTPLAEDFNLVIADNLEGAEILIEPYRFDVVKEAIRKSSPNERVVRIVLDRAI